MLFGARLLNDIWHVERDEVRGRTEETVADADGPKRVLSGTMLSLPSQSLPSLLRPSLLSSSTRAGAPRSAFQAGAARQQVRHRNQLAPKNTPYPKRQKGTIPVPTGGSIKGTTLAFGEWGIRIKGNGVRFSAKQLQTAEEVIKRKIKVIKGARVWLRVFPDIPVCIKVRRLGLYFSGPSRADGVCIQGNETRMGKGKGTFEFWATRYALRHARAQAPYR